jgi:steroid delta-isomerase-like uncharacterized protein
MEEDSTMANQIIERNREIGRRFMDFIMRGGDPSTLFAPDFVYYDAQGNAHDPADTMARIMPIRDAIPDRTLEVVEEIVTENRVVINWRRSGTFQNDLSGLRATGNRVNDVGLTILGIDADGRVSQVWEFWDLLNFFMQLGVIDEYIASIRPTTPAQGPS